MLDIIQKCPAATPSVEALAPIGRVTAVEKHPESDKLDIVTIGGRTNVANRPETGEPRYAVGDYAIMLREGLILPESLLRHLDLWDDVKGRGVLAGSKGNRTKSRRIAGVLSEVALCRVEWSREPDRHTDNRSHLLLVGRVTVPGHDYGLCRMHVVAVGDEQCESYNPQGWDVGDLLGVTAYVPVS